MDEPIKQQPLPKVIHQMIDASQFAHKMELL